MASPSPPPSSSSAPPQPPKASPPPTSLPNANSDPPTASSPPPLTSTSPPTPSPPPLSPPTSPPPAASPPPPITNSPPPASPSPPAPTGSSPPPSEPPPSPTLPPPPTSSAVPPAASPPPPSILSSPPPSTPPPPPSTSLAPPPNTPASSPPPDNRPPITVPPPSPAKHRSPPPPLGSPPKNLPSPPSANPPASSPPPPVPDSPAPAGSKTPPLTPSAPPPKTRPPVVPSPPSLAPTNSSNVPPSPPDPNSPPVLPPPKDSSGNANTPSGSGTNKSSGAGPNRTTGSGGGSATGGGGIKTGGAVAIALVSALVLLSLVGLAVWFVKKRKKPANGYAGGYVMPSPFASSQMSDSSYPRSPTAPLVHQSSGSHGMMYAPSEPGIGNSKSWFTYAELSAITNDFSTQNLLGEGGFGCVYKGCLQDGRQVAVKQLKVGGGQGEREFMAEVETISRIHHRHLVSLVGYCISENQRLLVYDYVPNNTLHYHLHGQGRPIMDWATRVKVAAGAARGIAYLHEDCHPRIIHRDIKSSNILLDNNFEAQVSDFGLARLAMDAWTHVTTRVMGTFGYLAPEYASTGKLTDKSDVFSFGVVLLELITGRKPVDDSRPLGDESLVEWARPLLSHALETRDFGDLPDPHLEKNYNESEMFRMIEAAAACVRHSAAMRPRMGQVLRALESLADIDLNNGVIPGQSELINSTQQSAEIRLFRRMAFGSQDYSTDFSQTSWKSRRES